MGVWKNCSSFRRIYKAGTILLGSVWFNLRGGEGRDFNKGERRGGEERIFIIYMFGSKEGKGGREF
jgi:hypothetical protein